MTEIAKNLHDTRERIGKATHASDRKAGEVTLVAVSKRQPLENIEAALLAGQRVFGENRVQEAQAHWADLKSRDSDIQLHLIGPLQTNKVKDAVALFDVIESVDRADLVRALAKETKKQGRDIPCLIQVNTGAEEQKAGILPQELPALLALCKTEGLHVEGLMCIPPAEEPPALHFAFLRKLAQEHQLTQLSMGMSGDFEKAIPLGATYVRVGTAIFGERLV